ncbi:MAG: SpoIIE family protein phosphatase [Acidobacteriaceae bacterium]|nr:SpoIIE family protein phosphatase [Acidobacteriaceae bacterium]
MRGAIQELLIHTPDGKVRVYPLDRDRIGLGRSSVNELCYPEDAGLSRQHLSIERNGKTWTVRDLGSKNGTMINGVRITGPQTAGPNDRITAGHLTLEFAAKQAPVLEKTVVFVEPPVSTTGSASTVVTSLAGILGSDREMEGGAHMKALIHAGKELAGLRPLDELFSLIMNLSIEAVGASRGVLMTIENKGELVVRAAKGDSFRISNTVRDQILNDRNSLLVRDARLDQAFAERMSIVEQQVRSILAVPLQTDTRVIGLIYLDSPHFVHEFTKDDLNLLTVMANVAAIRIEHARLAEVEQAERLLAKELEQAAVIQRGLLPTIAPVVPGLDLAGYNTPCRTVGGDYYDFLTYEDGRVAILVADVAGKGMPAAMLMSSLQARVQVLFDEPTNLAAVVTRLNKIIHTNCPSNRFITFFAGVFDGRTGDLTYCNAGHNPPLVLRSGGKVEELKSTGMILGILPAAKYGQNVCHLEPGDVIGFFSDGVTEACCPDSEAEFGEERLARILAEFHNCPAQMICDKVQQRLTEWMGPVPPADDVTLVIAKRTAD